MKNLSKGLIVAVLHILIVFSLGGKLLYDRAHRPRIWVKTGSVDPDLPIRGRYFTLSLEVRAPELAASPKQASYAWESVNLAVENGQLVAHQRNITLGDLIGNDYVVLSGIKPGEKIIVSGTLVLADGAPVQPQT